jgi:hypothetical protein
MMNEVAKRKEMLRKAESLEFSKTHGTFELCTCMPLGWVYAFVDRDRELYAFFDSSIYVTVADVQNATLKIQGKLFGRWSRDEQSA